MSKSNYTKSVMNKRNIYGIISFGIMLGFAITYLIMTFSGLNEAEEGLKEKIGSIAYSFGITLLILCALLVIVGHKIRTTIWMVSTVLGTYLFGTTGMYITFSAWLIDEYVIFNLYKHYKAKVLINKEIDKRE